MMGNNFLSHVCAPRSVSLTWATRERSNALSRLGRMDQIGVKGGNGCGFVGKMKRDRGERMMRGEERRGEERREGMDGWT